MGKNLRAVFVQARVVKMKSLNIFLISLCFFSQVETWFTPMRKLGSAGLLAQQPREVHEVPPPCNRVGYECHWCNQSSNHCFEWSKIRLPIPLQTPCGEESEFWQCDLCDDEKRRCIGWVETIPKTQKFFDSD